MYTLILIIKNVFKGTASTFKKETGIFEGNNYSTITPLNEPKGFQNLSVYVKVVLLEEGRTNKYLKHEYEAMRCENPFQLMYYCPRYTLMNKKISFLMHAANGTDILDWLFILPETYEVPENLKLPENE